MDNYQVIERKLATLDPINGHSMTARWIDSSTYQVWSYGTVIATCHDREGITLNPNRYSTTTSRHQNLVKRVWGVK